jgi:Flp pilus assembly protein TadD
MLKRVLVAMSVALALTAASIPLTVHSISMTPAEIAGMNAANAAAAGSVSVSGGFGENRDNVFVRVLKAPFKAIGKLFGHGNKNKLERLSEKDVKKFEKSEVTRVVDARTPAVTPPADDTATAPVPADPEAAAMAHLDRGQELLNSGNVNEAIAELSQAVALNHKLARAHNLLGVAYNQKNMPDMALDAFKKAADLDGKDAQILNNLGYMLYQTADYHRAERYLKRAVKHDAKNERAWNNLGLVQCQLMQFHDAFKSFEKATSEFDARVNIAVRMERLGYEKEAIAHLEKAHALRPKSDEVLDRLASLYDRTGQTTQALEARSELLTLRATALSK